MANYPGTDFPLNLGEYTYDYSEQLVAYSPLPQRADSRLLVVRRNPARGLPMSEDCHFSDLPQIIVENPSLRDLLLVRNRSKVLPARIYASRASGSRHEVLLTERVSATAWKALIRNVAKIRVGEMLQIENSLEKIEVLAPDTVRFDTHHVHALLEELGKVPLPPYIRRENVAEDKERYQSVWATGEALSSAAPTASLHFTEELWAKLTERMPSADVFLHVGRGTFEPLRETDLSRAQLHEEAFQVSSGDLDKILKAQGALAIGTTACRLVESLLRLSDTDCVRLVESQSDLAGWTKLFVRPGFEFKKVRALLTNFHLPESSLFVLVSVFAGSLKLSREAYAHAVNKDYRLFSYGDSSLWI